MKGFITNIETATLENEDYRRVLYTARNSQLVLMCLQPGDEIGEEVHELDQFIRFESGTGTVLMGDVSHDVSAEYAVLIPAGMRHNVINAGAVPLKLYSLYAPPEHRDQVVHASKADETEEHFDGVTTE